MTEAAAVEIALLQDGRRPGPHARALGRSGPPLSRHVAERAGSGGCPCGRVEGPGRAVSRSRTPRWRVEFGEEYLGTAETILDTAVHARTAYYEAVAAAQLAAMFDQTLEAEKAAAELANEQYRSGTTSRLDQARQHLAYAETFKAAAEAKRDAVAKHEALNRLLKLWGGRPPGPCRIDCRTCQHSVRSSATSRPSLPPTASPPTPAGLTRRSSRLVRPSLRGARGTTTACSSPMTSPSTSATPWCR